jgi:hypothetical protein
MQVLGVGDFRTGVGVSAARCSAPFAGSKDRSQTVSFTLSASKRASTFWTVLIAAADPKECELT